MTSAAGLVVTPGASADRDHRTLVALETGLELPVERVTIAGRAPGRVQEQLRADSAAFARRLRCDVNDLVIGGRSFGGRMCSMLAAGTHGPAQRPVGLVLLSYPLHPPGKPDVLRVDHFPAIDVPVLFVSGDRDPFGTPDEIRHHAAAIAGDVTFAWISGQGHSPRDDTPVVEAVAAWLATL